MSELRKQLQSLKREYQAARYPGKLADELFAPPTRAWSPWRIGGYVTVATGIAAAIMISLLHTKTITQPPPIPPTAIATTQNATEEAVMPVAALSTETFPDDIPLVPSGETLVPSAEAMELGSMPSFPSFDFSSISSTEEPT